MVDLHSPRSAETKTENAVSEVTGTLDDATIRAVLVTATRGELYHTNEYGGEWRHKPRGASIEDTIALCKEVRSLREERDRNRVEIDGLVERANTAYAARDAADRIHCDALAGERAARQQERAVIDAARLTTAEFHNHDAADQATCNSPLCAALGLLSESTHKPISICSAHREPVEGCRACGGESTTQPEGES